MGPKYSDEEVAAARAAYAAAEAAGEQPPASAVNVLLGSWDGYPATPTPNDCNPDEIRHNRRVHGNGRRGQGGRFR